MDYEKLYKESLEKAKAFCAKYVGDGLLISSEGSVAKEFNEIFQELRESEDERIRKMLIELVKKHLVNHERCMAESWLEKQGEHKSVEQDTENRDLWEYIREWRDKFGRLPKDEDELAACIDYVMKRQKPSDNYCQENCKGYRDTGGKCFADGECEAKKKAEQKSSWSEEDEKMKSLIISTLTSMGTLNLERYHHMNLDEVKNWLKSIKRNHWKPSEQQLFELEIAYKSYSRESKEYRVLESLYNSLLKL